MNINNLTKKPTLTKFTIDKPEIVEQYGEPIEFYSWDRQPIDVFLKLAALTGENNTVEIVRIASELILDEAGDPVITSDSMLPTNVLMAAIGEVTEKLGK